jgi:hypothetical protein
LLRIVYFLFVSELSSKTSKAEFMQCASSKETSELLEVILWSDNKMMCEGASHIARMIRYCHWHIVTIKVEILGIYRMSQRQFY